jgi:putative radical SAM enzyme (TIGR03279 family)
VSFCHFVFFVVNSDLSIVAKGIKIIEVDPGSLAAELELSPGDRIWTVNGKRVRDALDFKFLTEGEDELTLEVSKADGEEWQVEVEKDEGESWGIDFEPMTPRQCGNDCLFCFIQQNPEGSRPSLWVRDEDIRFSFMYGNYSTLTTISKAEVQRVIEQRLSPQYVSVHATDPELRAYLLGNDKKIDVIAQLQHFIDHGIEVHAQVVLCPTINDGRQLEQTIYDLAALHPGVVSTAIVPLGITDKHKYRDRLVAVSDRFCEEVIDQVAPLQESLRRKLRTVFAFLGDEFYIRAGRPIPPKSHYRIVRGPVAGDDEYPQIEDGVGMVRQFFDAHARRMKQLERMRKRKEFSEEQARKVYGTLATGEIFYPLLAEAVDEINNSFGTRLHVAPVQNLFFGPGITVAGLLSGRDYLNARAQFRGEFLMIPPHSYREYDSRFLDGMTVGELAAELVLPIKRTWNDVLGLNEDQHDHRTILSHDYGSVTSVSV